MYFSYAHIHINVGFYNIENREKILCFNVEISISLNQNIIFTYEEQIPTLSLLLHLTNLE